MKTLKFYQLTDAFKNEIEKKTTQELEHHNKMRYMHYILGAIMAIFPPSMSNASLYLNVQLGRTMDLSTAFTVLALFDSIRGPLGHLPHIYNQINEIKTSMKRL